MRFSRALFGRGAVGERVFDGDVKVVVVGVGVVVLVFGCVVERAFTFCVYGRTRQSRVK